MSKVEARTEALKIRFRMARSLTLKVVHQVSWLETIMQGNLIFYIDTILGFVNFCYCDQKGCLLHNSCTVISEF